VTETATPIMPDEGFLPFTSPQVGHWIGCPAQLWTTTDGGTTWTSTTPP
jgi:hypothetical protein